MSDYIQLTKAEFEETLPEGFTIVDNPHSKEFIYSVPTPRELVSVVIYSSVDILSEVTRSVGQDAIRIVFWHDKENRPLGKGKRIYRVTSKESISNRIKKTIASFLSSVNTLTLVDWVYVGAILRDTAGDFAKSLREQLEERGRLSQGQLVYIVGEVTPKGRDTMEQALKKRGWLYDPGWEDEIDTPDETEEVFEPVNENIITDKGREVELISTEGYPYPFEKFNPVQSMVHPLRNLDVNMVISANTSAGKTICAELIMEEVLKW